MNIIKDDNELSIFLNDKGLIYLDISESGEDMYAKYINLDKEDATNLRNELDKLIKQME